MAEKKYVLVALSVPLHAKFRHRARLEGRPMAKIVRQMIEEYVAGPTPEPAPLSVLDQVAAMAVAAAQD